MTTGFRAICAHENELKRRMLASLASSSQEPLQIIAATMDQSFSFHSMTYQCRSCAKEGLQNIPNVSLLGAKSVANPDATLSPFASNSSR